MAMTDDERRQRARESRERYLARNDERLRAERKAKYAANPEAAKAAATSHRMANPAAHKAAVKRYRASNPDIRRAEKAKRRAAIRGVGGSYTKADVQALHAQQGGLCVYCRANLERFEVDHILPLALGGANDVSNLQILCAPCNRANGAQHPDVFAQRAAACGK